MIKQLVRRIFKSHFVQFGVSALITLITLLCIFTPDMFLVKQGANFTVHIMLSFLMLGLFFLTFDLKRLLMVSFTACAVLCLYLKSVSNQNIRLPKHTTETQVSIAHFNLSLSESFEATIETIKETKADILSFQEVTPDWDEVLRKELSSMYPCDIPLVRIDPYGMSFFSKYPFESVDTFYTNQVPNLYICVKPDGNKSLHLVSSHPIAPVNKEAYQQISEHFKAITGYIDDLDGAVIALGDYHLPSWSDEIKQFKKMAALNDSRRDIVPVSLKGMFSFLRVPIDHILYTDPMECTAFNAISGPRANYLGIMGTYQYKTENGDHQIGLD